MIRLTSKQQKAWRTILEDPSKRRILFDGGARSTKTALICAWLLVQAATYDGIRILIARKNTNAARKSIWEDTLSKLLVGRNDFRRFDSGMQVHYKNSMIRVDGLDDNDRVDKVLGTEYSHIFFNEATQISYATIQTVLSRLAQPSSVPARKAIFDCNPKNQRHWLYKTGVMHQHPETGEPIPDADIWARMHWTPYDNPHLPKDALATLENLTGTQRRRMLLGEWCEQEGAVYDEFSDDVHVFSEYPKGSEDWMAVRSIDFGYTNPFVCLLGRVDPDGRLWIVKEHYKSKMIVQDHAAEIKRMCGDIVIEWTVADHDAEDRATLMREDIHTLPAKKEVQAGIDKVKARLRVQSDGRPRLMIHSSCKETISEFMDYCWRPGSDKSPKEEPLKERDHAMDALRYMVMRLDHARTVSLA